MARPRVKAGEDTVALAVRLPESLVRRLDRHVTRLRGQLPGYALTRADAMRALISEGLDRADAKRPR